MTSTITMKEDIAPATPPSGYVRLYAKADGQYYYKGDDGVEHTLAGATGATGATGPSGAGDNLVDFLHVDSDTGHRDLIRAGWFPAFYNQQWGGAPHYFELVDAATGTPYCFEAATGNIDEDGSNQSIASVAGNTWVAQGFKVSKTTTLSAVWVKIYKVGNPTNNLECRILSDDGTGKPSGSTPITNGTATAQSGRLHTADQFGQWVRFVFPTPPSVTAGTQYHITLKSSGAVDASNYWNWRKHGSAGKYPHGQYCNGDATPTWTAFSTHDACFLVEIASADQSLQTGGIFSDGKLTFFEGSPLNQSNGRVKDLRDFAELDLTDFTLAVYGSAWTKDKTILDITYGLDHDRIVLRCNATTGFAQVDLYDSAGTKKTVTGAVDVSAGNSLVAIRVRAKGDGADALGLYTNGVAAAGNLSAQTIAFDKLFGLARVGTFWLGGGFNLAPTWSGSSISSFSALPSTLGWTWTGAATEANAMSVSGGRLYQNKNGYTSAQDGYYLKGAAGLSNANGSCAVARVRPASDTNSKDSFNIGFGYQDGTRQFSLRLAEYYATLSPGTGGSWFGYPQADLKSFDQVAMIISKGTDSMAFLNGRIAIDATAVNMGTSANNQLFLGDSNTAAGENADAVWSYVKYYTTAWQPPQFTSGSLSELAIWNGDRTSLFSTLWNGGSPISVKVQCGQTINHGAEVKQLIRQTPITNGPTTASSSFSTLAEMEAFCVGRISSVRQSGTDQHSQATNYAQHITYIDGEQSSHSYAYTHVSVASAVADYATDAARLDRYFGLHKAEGRWLTSAPTATNVSRTITVEAKA